ATVIIKCDMDFVLYPLDVQKCAVDFSSYKYTMGDMMFSWWTWTDGIMIPSDFGDGYRLPKYVVRFQKMNHSQFITYGEGNHSTARMFIIMRRELRSYLLETYLPSSLFVIMSWGSFVVIPDMVPGRMVLLVTTLLSLVTMFDTVRIDNSPSALELKCIEVWLISCTLFVFFALLEYFIVLFGIRYDKFWRHKKRDLDRINAMSTDRPNENNQPTTMAAAVAAATAAAAASNNTVVNNHHRPAQLPPLLHHRKTAKKRHNNVSELISIEQHGSSNGGAETLGRRKFRMVAEYVVLYCGSQRGMVDQVSLVLFPICFMLFTIIYWVSYVSSAAKHDQV
ncbi:hypothetical protein L9F63_013559, partial [Diploptera punctata]